MLDPLAAQLLTVIGDVHPSGATVSEARERFAAGGEALKLLKPPPPVPYADVTRATPLGVTRLRRYDPVPTTSEPPIVYFHGGGFVLGDVDVYHPWTAHLASALRRPVWSVDYPRAPEHHVDQIVEDCWQSLCEIARREAGAALVLAGDSAGGTLAAVMAQYARDRGGPRVLAQALYCPATDMTLTDGSIELYGEGYFLTREALAWFLDLYLEQPTDAFRPVASPALHPNLRDLPPALIVTAEYDPLRDHGERYAQLLEANGVPVALHRYDGMIHDFAVLPLPQAEAVLAETRDFLSAWASP